MMIPPQVTPQEARLWVPLVTSQSEALAIWRVLPKAVQLVSGQRIEG